MPSSPPFNLGFEVLSPVRGANLDTFQGTIYRSEPLLPAAALDEFMRTFIRESVVASTESPVDQTDASYLRAFSIKICLCGDNILRHELDVDNTRCLDNLSDWEVVFLTTFLGANGTRGFLCFFDRLGGREVVTFLPRERHRSSKWLDDAVQWRRCLQRMIDRGLIAEKARSVWRGGLIDCDDGDKEGIERLHFERIFRCVVATFEGNYHEERWWEWVLRVLRPWGKVTGPKEEMIRT